MEQESRRAGEQESIEYGDGMIKKELVGVIVSATIGIEAEADKATCLPSLRRGRDRQAG